MSLPQSFAFFANRLQGFTRNTVRVSPSASTTVKNNQSIELVMPNNAIVDLTTLRLTADFKYQTATSATNAIRYVPSPHQLVRSSVFQLNGNSVSGQSNQNFAQVYEALKRASVGDDHAKADINCYSEVPVATLNGAVTSKVFGSGSERAASNTVSRRITMTEFLGLQRSPNAPSMDTSIVGNIRLVLQMNGSEAGFGQADDAFGATDFDWQLDNVEAQVDVISMSSPMYDELMSALLSEPDAQLLIPFPEYTSQKSLINTNVKYNVSSSSLDMIAFAPLHADHSGATRIATSSGVPPNGQGTLVPKQTQFSYRNDSSALASSLANQSDSVTATYHWNVNGTVIPARGATNINDGAQYTKELYGHQDVHQGSALFEGYFAEGAPVAAGTVPSDGTQVYPTMLNKQVAKQYSRVNYLDYNCIVAHRLCLDLPAHQSPTRTASGISTLGQASSLSLNLTGFNNNTDSVLIYSLGSAILSVGANQQSAVIY